MTFDMDHPMPHFKGTKKGRAYLTTHRVSQVIDPLCNVLKVNNLIEIKLIQDIIIMRFQRSGCSTFDLTKLPFCTT